MPGRKYNIGDYRYGFNGKEADRKKEWASFVHYDYGFRIYNPALGRFLSVDPLIKEYPELTPYQFASNNSIAGIDLDGLEFSLSTTRDNRVYVNAHFKILNSSDVENEVIKILAVELKNGFNNLFRRDYAKKNFYGWFSFEIVDKVQESDFYIEFANPDDPRLKGIEGKANDIGGTNAVVSIRELSNIKVVSELDKLNVKFHEAPEIIRTGLHEIGHLLGLLHPWDLEVINQSGETFRQISSFYETQKRAEGVAEREQIGVIVSDNIDLKTIFTNLMNSGANPHPFLDPSFNSSDEDRNLTDEQFGKIYQFLYENYYKKAKNE